MEGSFSVQIKIKDLFLEDFYRTASGRVLISFLSPEDRKSFISNYGLPSKEEWKESSTYEGLEKSIGSICKKGEEMSRVMEKAYFQAAVPVLDRDGKCVAALAVPVPSFRFRGAQKKKIMTELRSTAWKISAALSQTVQSTHYLYELRPFINIIQGGGPVRRIIDSKSEKFCIQGRSESCGYRPRLKMGETPSAQPSRDCRRLIRHSVRPPYPDACVELSAEDDVRIGS